MPDRMVSMVAKTLKDKRQYDALVDIFQEADTSNDGKVGNLNTENSKKNITILKISWRSVIYRVQFSF